MVEMQGWADTEYKRAASLFTEMDHLRRIWGGLRPEPPLKRSDLALLSAIFKMSERTGEPANVSAVAHMMKQSKPGISQKVNVLEEGGYLRRIGDKKDRRVTYLELTDKGEKCAARSLREFLGRVEAALDNLGDKNTNELLALMRALSESIEQVQGNPPQESGCPGGDCPL